MGVWSISKIDAESLIIQVFCQILEGRNNVNEHELCVRMSTDTNYNKIRIYKNGKRRNLNNLMKQMFNGLTNFLKKNDSKFSFKNKIIRLK